jgi:hypothetical protein
MNSRERLHAISPLLYRVAERVYRHSPVACGGVKSAHELMRMSILNASQEQRRLFEQYFGGELRVLDGPFRGMSYLAEACGSFLGPKLVGSYEAELWDWVEEAVAAGYPAIIDIGSAEGYYAVGFAFRSMRPAIYAFDTDPDAQRACETLARANGVHGRITICGECGPETLQSLLSERALVFCDIEGAERELLDPKIVPALATADLIVETHDHRSPGVSALLESRFSRSHRIERVTARSRSAGEFRSINTLPTAHQLPLLDEGRPPDQVWLRMLSKQNGWVHSGHDRQ